MARKAPASRATISKNCKIVFTLQKFSKQSASLTKVFLFRHGFPIWAKTSCFLKNVIPLPRISISGDTSQNLSKAAPLRVPSIKPTAVLAFEYMMSDIASPIASIRRRLLRNDSFTRSSFPAPRFCATITEVAALPLSPNELAKSSMRAFSRAAASRRISNFPRWIPLRPTRWSRPVSASP